MGAIHGIQDMRPPPWTVATSGQMAAAQPTLELLKVPPGVLVVTRDQVPHAKPDPDLFLVAAEHLGADVADAVVVRDPGPA